MGVIGCIDYDDQNIFKDLIWVGGLRGTDNTGVASVKYDEWDAVNLLKITGGPNELFDRKSLDTVIKNDVAVLLGHNRSKTFGTTAPKDAHPFVFQNIVGSHNGTLTWQSKNKMKDDTKFGTDSEALFCDIDEHGFENTIKKMEGAWALVWYDRRTKVLNFHRNKERFLYYVTDKQNSTLYWASEPGFLYLVLNRHKIEFNKVKEVPENTWVRWQVNDKQGFTLDKPIHRNLVAPPFQTTTYSTRSNGSWPTDKSGINGVSDRFCVVDRKTLEEQRVNNIRSIINNPQERMFDVNKNKISKDLLVLDLYEKGKLDLDIWQKHNKDSEGFYKLPDNSFILKERFNDLMNDGCVICDCHPIWREPVKFLKDNSFICPSCLYDESSDSQKTVVELIRNML